MESATTLAANQKQCPQCGRPMPTWRGQCEVCSAELAQLPPKLQWKGQRIQRPGFVTFYVVLACLGAIVMFALGLMSLVSGFAQANQSTGNADAALAGPLSIWIAPAIATIVIGVFGLWRMKLWAWTLTVIQLSTGMILILGAVLLTLATSTFVQGGLSIAFGLLVPGMLTGGVLFWFLSNRQDFIVETAPINKPRLLMSSLLGSVLGILLSIILLGVLAFLSLQQSDLTNSLVNFLMLPTIAIVWLFFGPIVSVWLYRALAEVTWVPAEHGAIVGITTGVVSALLTPVVASVLLALLRALIAFGALFSVFGGSAGQQGNLVPPLDIAPLQFAGLDQAGLLAALLVGLLLVLPYSFFGWIGGSLGVRTQKNSRSEAVMEP